MNMQFVLEYPGIQDHGPKLRTRRPHTKSRHGCKSCRSRRIKCDERQPQCSQCVERKLPCEYRDQSPGDINNDDSHSTTTFSKDREILKVQFLKFLDETTPECPKFVNPIYRAEDAVGLIEHFLDCPEPWLGSPNVQRILQQHAANWSIGNPYLLQALLAISSAHMQNLHPKAAIWRIAAAFHYSHAVKLYLAQMFDGVEHSDAEGLFASGYLLALFDMSGASELYDNRMQDELLTTKDSSRWGAIRSMQGLATLLASPLLTKSFAQSNWCRIQDEWQHFRCLQCQDASLHQSLSTNSPVARMIQDLQDLATVTKDELDACQRSIWLLGELQQSDLRPDEGKLLAWLATLPVTYLQMLERDSPLALFGITVWSMLALQLKQWWLAAFAERQLRKSRRLLMHTNDDVGHKLFLQLEEALFDSTIVDAA